MKNKKSKISKYAYDHWLVIFTSIITIGGLSFLSTVRDIVMTIIGWQYSGWIMSVLILTICFIVHHNSKKPVESGGMVRLAPRYIHHKASPSKLYGVMWSFWRGNNTPLGFNYALGNKPLRGWVDGPFCPECDYELEKNAKGTKWVCIKCQGNYKIPEDIQNDTREKIIKIFEADIRKQERQDEKLPIVLQ